jgi:hypothetical protein
VDSEAKNAWRILIAGLVTSLIGLLIFVVRTKMSEAPEGQWVSSWYDISFVKYLGRGHGGRYYMQQIGDLICAVSIFGGLGVAYIGFQYLRDHGYLDL